MAGPAFSIGQLREAIRFDRRQTTDDGYGNTVASWRPLTSTYRAAISPQKGGEEVRAARLTGITPFDVVVRSSEETRGVTTADRIVDERSGKTYDIKSIINLDERNRFLLLVCTSGGAD